MGLDSPRLPTLDRVEQTLVRTAVSRNKQPQSICRIEQTVNDGFRQPPFCQPLTEWENSQLHPPFANPSKPARAKAMRDREAEALLPTRCLRFRTFTYHRWNNPQT